MATFLADKKNSTEGGKTGLTAHVHIMFAVKDKKKCRVFEDIFPWK